MSDLISLSPAERLYGLSLIWQEANYNFAFFDRLPDLNWDAAYREYIPKVLAAEDLFSYYEILQRFAVLLKDNHTGVAVPAALHFSLDRPRLILMNVENSPVITNASGVITAQVPIGSKLLAVDGIPAEEYLAERVMPLVSESNDRRRRDHAVARLLLGPKGSRVKCEFLTPAGQAVELELTRDRKTSADPWLRPHTIPDPWEFMYFDEWVFEWFNWQPPFTPFEFKILDGNIAYFAVNSFIQRSGADAFDEKLSTINRCSGLIVDVRKNHGGSDSTGYSIASHLICQPTEKILVHTPQTIAYFRAAGVNLKDTLPEQVADLGEWDKTSLLSYKRQLQYEIDWGNIQPSSDKVTVPTVVLQDTETASAAEDFLMALISGKAEVNRIGRNSAGISGMPLIQDLPGGGGLGLCTVRMPWSGEGSNEGIAPNMWVEPTIDDVIKNEDRMLKTAIQKLGET